MSVTNIDPLNVLPDMFSTEEITTGSKMVLRNQLMDVHAVDQVTYDPVNQNQIRIKIMSPGDFLRGAESYLQFDLTITGPNVATTFPIGGAHNLFSRVQVRTLGRGVILQEVDYYNEVQAIEHLFNIKKSFVEQFGPLYLETSQTTPSVKSLPGSRWAALSIDAARLLVYYAARSLGSNVALTTSAVVADDFNFIIVGDEICIAMNDGSAYYYGLVYDMWGTEQGGVNMIRIAFYGRQAPAADFAAGTFSVYIRRAHTLRGGQIPINAATLIPEANRKYNVLMQLALPIASMNFPLFLMKDGIELLLDLNKASSAFTSTVAASYTIANPKYMCKFVTPHPQIQDSFEAMFNSKKGLVYSLPSIRVKQQQVAHTAGSIPLYWQVGCRSAQHIIMKFTDSGLYTNTAYDVTMSHPMNIKEYQMFVGSLQFPQRPVSLGLDGAEGWMQLLHSFGLMGNEEIIGSFAEYYTEPLDADSFRTGFGGMQLSATVADNIRQPLRFFIGTKFNRVDGYGRELTGIDLSHVPLETRLNTGDKNTSNGIGTLAGANMIATLIVYYDAYLKIQRDQLAVYS